MQITIYSPDRHLIYDGSTPDSKGVGGGLTARVRIATALAARGHQVCVVCNCPVRRRYNGVSYIPLASVDRIAADVLIAHSSGDQFDISSLLTIPVTASVRVVVISGTGLPHGTAEFGPHSIYACSNFMRNEIARLFPLVPASDIFVSYYGVNRWNWPNVFAPKRDPKRLIYSSHPSKGLEASREVARRLRQRDERFTLHAYGGNELWGGKAGSTAPEPGLFFPVLVSQRDLATQYKRSGFRMQLQNRAEPFRDLR